MDSELNKTMQAIRVTLRKILPGTDFTVALSGDHPGAITVTWDDQPTDALQIEAAVGAHYGYESVIRHVEESTIWYDTDGAEHSTRHVIFWP
jgi:hypothetical protein